MDQLVIEVPSPYTSVDLRAAAEAALPPDVYIHVRRYDSRGRLVSDTCRGVTVLGPASARVRKSAPWWRRLAWALTGALCLALPLPVLAAPDAGTPSPVRTTEKRNESKEEARAREAHERLWCPDSEYLGWDRKHDLPICAPIGTKG